MQKASTCSNSELLLAQYATELLHAVTIGAYVTDSAGVTLFVNRSYERTTGLRAEDLCGKNVAELTRTGIFNTALNPTIVKTGKPASTVQQLRKKRVFLQGFPIFAPSSKEVVMVITFVRDVTSITRLSKQVSQQGKQLQDYHELLSFISEETTKEPGAELLQSDSMQTLMSRLRKIAETDASLLLIGETGSGKDVLAKKAHALSQRRDKIFLKVDCGSISPALIESELFGYVPGAFSGAAGKGKPGYFEAADGGTIMLDEIGELPLAMQTRFLRVLQDGEIMRVGDTTPRTVDVRIIAATNVNLEEAVDEGKFRKDLYYRLNVAQLRVPPLRERQADIRPFLEYFLELYKNRYHHEVIFSEASLRILENYSWPGNVRELQNLVQGLVVNREMVLIQPEDLPPHIYATDKKQLAEGLDLPTKSMALGDIVANLERDIIEATIARTGSMNAAAEFLQVNRSTLFRKLQRMGKEG
ncbi:sigma-54 interaction domain-containing protein [Desulfovibrio cuneatus]|uniref:sigma-54 interaction domain-containing protein n=1 Tax=Desulfovibrio cuneatus TaxID=159728 RepID=UPI0004109625|nr:sigma 54-interacting transcriptional regulator [Desulfovibrio cuneatus]